MSENIKATLCVRILKLQLCIIYSLSSKRHAYTNDTATKTAGSTKVMNNFAHQSSLKFPAVAATRTSCISKSVHVMYISTWVHELNSVHL